MTGYRQCTRCVMDTTDPDIRFDSNGFCNHCTEFLKSRSGVSNRAEVGDRTLRAIVSRIKAAGRNKPYDCIVGISGGVDSSYVAYLSKSLGLRPLAVHMDNGWNSEEAVRNIRKVCMRLKVDYQSYVLDWDVFRDVQLAFLKASIVEVEIPTDVAIIGALHRVAAQVGVKYILSGGNLATEGILPRSWFYYPKDSRLFWHICRTFGTKKISQFPTFDYLEEIYYKFLKGIRTIYILNYVPYAKADGVKLLKEELGWVDYGGKHHESVFTKLVQGYIQPVKFQVDYRKATYSTEICMGVLTREKALELLKKLPYDDEKIDSDRAYAAKKLGLSLAEFDQILRLPVKSYRDYPNNEKLLAFIYAVYQRIYRTARI